jgi:LSD1 subclass zinc finger protein
LRALRMPVDACRCEVVADVGADESCLLHARLCAGRIPQLNLVFFMLDPGPACIEVIGVLQGASNVRCSQCSHITPVAGAPSTTQQPAPLPRAQLQCSGCQARCRSPLPVPDCSMQQRVQAPWTWRPARHAVAFTGDVATHEQKLSTRARCRSCSCIRVARPMCNAQYAAW